MDVFNLVFYGLLILLTASCLFIFLSKSSVQSLILLILIFLNSASALFLLDTDFLGIILIILYVGAIAVLFLFVIMMLSNKGFPFDFTVYYIVASLIIISVFSQAYSFFKDFFNFPLFNSLESRLPSFLIDDLSVLNLLGQVLFNEYNQCFLLAGFILLVAIVGAVSLSSNFVLKEKSEIFSKQLSHSNNNIYFFN